MKRIMSMLLIAAMALTAFSACETDDNTTSGDNGTNTSTSLVGTTWSDVMGIMTLSFTSETSVTQSMAGVNVTYDYTYADGQGTIGTVGVVLYTFTVSGNTMSIFNEAGEMIYSLNKTDGSTPSDTDDMTNSTWVYDNDIEPYGYEELMIMFLPNKMCGVSYEATDGQGEMEQTFEGIGSYTYSNNAGTFTVTNPDNPTESYQGSYTVSGNTLTANFMNRNFTLTKFTIPSK